MCVTRTLFFEWRVEQTVGFPVPQSVGKVVEVLIFES